MIDDITQEEWDNSLREFYESKKQEKRMSEMLEQLEGYDPQPKVDEYRKHVADLNKPSSKQVGGTHYKKFKIQPAEFCYKNEIPYLEATAIKYLCRWKDKGGIQDLEKAKHFIDLLIEFNNANN
jgi:hypothetical protein